MSKRGYINQRNPEDRRGARQTSLRTLLSRRKRPEWLDDEEEDDSGHLKAAQSPSGSYFSTESEHEDDYYHGAFGTGNRGEHMVLPPLNSDGHVVTEALQFRPSSPEGSTHLEVFIAKTSPPSKREGLGQKRESFGTSQNVPMEEEKWVWPWPEFAVDAEDESSKVVQIPLEIDAGAIPLALPESPDRRIRFADEEGHPIHEIRERPEEDDDADPEWMTVLILLMNAQKKKFEVIHISYNVGDRLPLSEVIKRIPEMASTPLLAEQSYSGFIRPLQKGVELINSFPIQDCGLERDEALVANVNGMSAKKTVRLAYPLLVNPEVLKTVRRHTRHGYRVHKLTSDDFVADNCDDDPDTGEQSNPTASPMLISAGSDDSDNPIPTSIFAKLKQIDVASEASRNIRKTTQKEDQKQHAFAGQESARKAMSVPGQITPPQSPQQEGNAVVVSDELLPGASKDDSNQLKRPSLDISEILDDDDDDYLFTVEPLEPSNNQLLLGSGVMHSPLRLSRQGSF